MVKTHTLPINWEAQEYIQRDKNTGWYIGLILVGVIFSVGAILLQWWTFLALIIVSVVALIIYSIRPPRNLHYSLTQKGIEVDKKLHEYTDFKSFGIVNEDGHYSAVLIPRKRFSPRFTLFFPKELGEQITDTIGQRLPMQEIKPDFLDKIVKFLRI